MDPEANFIYHGSLIKKVDLLTLVKKKKNTLFSTDYEVMDVTFAHLLPEFASFSEYTEETVIKDYQYSGQNLVKADIHGGVGKDSAGVKGEAHSEQKVSSVSIKAKKADIVKLKEKYCGQKINTGYIPKLKKGEVLAFVDKIVFNTADVTLSGKTGVDGSCEASWNVFVKFLLAGNKKTESSFTVPAGQVYAYSLKEIKFNDEEIAAKKIFLGPDAFESDNCTAETLEATEAALASDTFEPDNCTEKTFETMQQVQEELLRTDAVLQPLAQLPQETRFALSKSLSQLPEDRDALALLKQKLDQWREGERSKQPQSWSDCSVLRLLTKSENTDVILEAVDMLVSAMDKLPESVPSLIGNCHPDTLKGLNQLVSRLKERGQAHVPESLPAPLQDGGELHWLTVFLCSSEDYLREQFELGMVAGNKPGVLLLALCVTVQGLSVMQD